jgi:hypothetical protein
MARMTGSWKQARTFLTDPATALHEIDPRHFGGQEPEDTNNPSWQNPDPAPAGGVSPDYMVDYVGNEWYPYNAYGADFDHTPHDSSVGYAGSSGEGMTDAQNRAEAGAAHEMGYGASVQSNVGNALTLRPVDQADERYVVERFESDRAVQLNPAVASRGFNGQSLNSDEALIRPGLVEMPFVHRKMLAPAQRVHDARLYTPNTATVPTDAPPVPTPWGNPYSKLARAMTRTWQTPMVRRDPPPMDEQLVEDGADAQYAVVGDEWVIG